MNQVVLPRLYRRLFHHPQELGLGFPALVWRRRRTTAGHGWRIPRSAVGWDQPGVAEMVPVAVGQHPLSNIGRSFHNGKQPPTNDYDVTEFTNQGLHFAEQWQRALEVDPEFIFITGWNEWMAGSAVCEDPSQEALQALWDFFPGPSWAGPGKQLKKGDRYFIDQYNQEYSRDAEPMKGGHADNYYYQMLANIRRFKGSPAAACSLWTGRPSTWRQLRPVAGRPAGISRSPV